MTEKSSQSEEALRSPPEKTAPFWRNSSERGNVLNRARARILGVLEGKEPIPAEAPAWLRDGLSRLTDERRLACSELARSLLSKSTLGLSVDVALGWHSSHGAFGLEREELPDDYSIDDLDREAAEVDALHVDDSDNALSLTPDSDDDSRFWASCIAVLMRSFTPVSQDLRHLAFDASRPPRRARHRPRKRRR